MSNHKKQEQLRALFVMMGIVFICFAILNYMLYKNMVIYQKYGIITTATYQGSASYAQPSLIESKYSTARVVFSTGVVLEGSYQMHFANLVEDYVDPGYTKTLTEGQKVNIVYFKENPEADVIFEDYLITYFKRSFWSKYGILVISFILMLVFFIFWRRAKKH